MAGFVTLILAFGSVAGYSHRLQTQAVESMRLANEGYLRLTLLLDEVRVNQGVFNTLLDRLPDERDRVNSRTWIAAARRTRRGRIAQCRALAQSSLHGARATEDVRLLGRAVAQLGAIDRTYEADEPALDSLFQILARGGGEQARDPKDRLLVREGSAEDALRGLTRDFQRRVQTLSDEAEGRQHRSAQLTLAATVVACALGLATALNARRALNPLALLRDRARAVARGDLAPATVPARPDEIGELANEFERMVNAIRARDAALRSANVEIQAAERHLEQVVASLRAAVMVVRADGRISTANDAARRLSDCEMLAGRPYQGTLYGGDGRVAAVVQSVAAGETSDAESFEAVALGDRVFDVTVVPFVERGERAGALVVTDDVTEREQAKARWIQAERLAAIGRMAAHVTHEVRNPLSSMALNAEMLADEVGALGAPGAEAGRLVAAIQREIDRLTGITEEYLRVARLPQPRLEPEDVGDLVTAALGFVAAEMNAAGVEVVPEVVPEVIAMVDEAQLRQALLNLLRNAREAMEAARVARKRLGVRVRATAGGVEIAVTDSGPGFAPAARGRLFELFFTTKERGTGLGLPLTREIVAAHGGTIRAEQAGPEDGGGARFVIWLPGAAAPGEDETHAA